MVRLEPVNDPVAPLTNTPPLPAPFVVMTVPVAVIVPAPTPSAVESTPEVVTEPFLRLMLAPL